MEILTRPPLVPARRGGHGTRARDRALFVNFFTRELTTRYLGSVTGLAWALLNPLALLAVYHFVFTTVFRTASFDGTSFLLFVAVALWPWLAAQEGLVRATTSLASHAGLIRKVAFPHEIVVYASVGATLALQFVGYVVVLIALRAFGEPVRFEGLIVAVPLWIVLAIAVTGIALFLAALQVFIRDVEHVLVPILMIGMYLTPILYPLTLVPEGMRPLGRRQSVRLARDAPARSAARRTPRAALGRCGRAGGRARAVLRGAMGVPPAVAALRGLSVVRTDDDDVAAHDRQRRQGLREGRLAWRPRAPRL